VNPNPLKSPRPPGNSSSIAELVLEIQSLTIDPGNAGSFAAVAVRSYLLT
jgi:hypothetical protein